MIILVTGAAGSGKGQVSDTLVKLLGANEISFAQPMKKWAIEYFDFPVWDCYNSREEAVRAGFTDAPEFKGVEFQYGKTSLSRHFLQRFGDFMKDKVKKTFWADEAAMRIMLSGVFDHVISDWRFPYEEDVIRHKFPGAKVITLRVIRSDLPPIEAGASHCSETALTDDMNYDKKIYNDGSLADLEKKVTEWVEELSAAMESPKTTSSPA